MKEEVGSFTPENEVEGPQRSRIRCILLCVTLITLVSVAVVLAILFSYAKEPPGLSVHPNDVVVMRVWDDTADSQQFVRSLDAFAAKYDDLPSEQSLRRCSVDEDKGNGKCLFSLTWLQSPCSKADEWGIKEWKPCILLSFNEPRDWIPEPYANPQELPPIMPKSLRKHIEKAFANGDSTKFLWVSCGGDYPSDRESLGNPLLSPWPGFPVHYFPMRHDTSQLATPVLALQAPDAQNGVLISIKCYFWAKNIPTPYIAAHIEYLLK